MRIVLVSAGVVLVLAACSSGRGPGSGSGPGSGGRETAHAPAPSPAVPSAVPSSGPSTGPLTDGAGSPPSESRPGAHAVTFAVRGDMRRVSVTYVLPGGRRHRAVVVPPWSRTFTVTDGQSVELNAHATGDGELTCTITVDGEPVKSATSSGGSGTVDCGDELGF